MKAKLKKVIVAVITWQAKQVLAKYRPTVIAVTGSVGKTSTKDAIYTVLKDDFRTRASQKSFNSDLGIPLTILNLPNAWGSPLRWVKNILRGFSKLLLPGDYPEVLILEVGTDKPGDIEAVSAWLKTDIVVFTAIGKIPVHVANFPDVEAVVADKKYLIRTLNEDGILVLNADDERVADLQLEYNGPVVFYGSNDLAEVRFLQSRTNYKERRPDGVNYRFSVDGEGLVVSLPDLLGEQWSYPLGAALSVARVLKLDVKEVATNFSAHQNTPGRMHILPGRDHMTIIDDSYNSSPLSATAALNTLRELSVSGRKVAILGSMLELGEYSISEHKKIGALAIKVADVVITVGEEAERIFQEADSLKQGYQTVVHFASVTDLLPEIEKMLKSEDTVLVKGSQGIRLEKVIAQLLADGVNPAKVLVRQEAEWLRK